MKNALILHGSGNNSSGNWFPWLKKELLTRSYQVFMPDLPNSDEPNLDEWLGTIFSFGWEFNYESVLVGHSSGATLILRILEELPEDVRVNKVIMVAGFVELGINPEIFKYKRGLLKKPFNYQKIKQSANKFYFIHSDDDPYLCGKEQGEILQRNLGGELLVMNNQGHFNLEVGEKYKKFPELLTYL